MKLGIKNIKIIAASSAQDWSFLPRLSAVRLSSFISSSFTDLVTVQTEAEMSAGWETGESGQKCVIELSGVNRTGAETAMTALSELMGRGIIAVVKTVQGEEWVVGSKGYPARLNLDFAIGGVKSKQLRWSISCTTPQGLLYTTV